MLANNLLIKLLNKTWYVCGLYFLCNIVTMIIEVITHIIPNSIILPIFFSWWISGVIACGLVNTEKYWNKSAYKYAQGSRS